MKKILFIRRAKDYYYKNKSFLNYNNINTVINKSILSRNFYLWNIFFKMSYMEFRKKLHNIVKFSYSSSFDEIFLWDNYELLEKYPRNSLVIPIDDDDIISPFIIEKILQYDLSGKNILKWNVFTCSPYGQIFRDRRKIYRSCSYGVFLPFKRDAIKKNVLMSLRYSSSPNIEETLSVKLDNIASISFLGKIKFERIINIAKRRCLIEDTNKGEYQKYLDSYNNLLLEFYDSFKYSYLLH